MPVLKFSAWDQVESPFVWKNKGSHHIISLPIVPQIYNAIDRHDDVIVNLSLIREKSVGNIPATLINTDDSPFDIVGINSLL
jgi:hypothetical protein